MDKWIRTTKNWLYAALACFAAMATLNADLSSIGAEAADGGFWNLLAANIKKLEYLLPVFTYRDGLLAFLIFFFFLKTESRFPDGISKTAYRVPAALTAFFLVFGYSFRYTNSWNLVFMDTFHTLASALMLAGFYFLFTRVYELLIARIHRCAFATGEKAVPGAWIFEKHGFWGPFLAILLCWLPYIIAKFPGASTPETLAEMRQYYWHSLNNYYPPPPHNFPWPSYGDGKPPRLVYAWLLPELSGAAWASPVRVCLRVPADEPMEDPLGKHCL